MVLPLDEFTLNAEVVRTRTPLIISDVHREPRWITIEASSWIRSVVMVPICLHERVLGVINLDSSEVSAFTEKDATRLMPLANAAAIAIANARLMENLEVEVAARTVEIAAERDKTQAILRSAGDAIAVLDTDLMIQYVNPAFEQLTGYQAEACLGKIIHPVVAGQLSEQGILGMRTAYATATEWRGEIVLHRQDGRAYDAAMTVAPIRDADGAVWGHVVSHQDISRFKALERARNQFITSISHELRTPLTVLDLSVRKMQQQIKSGAEHTALDAMNAQIGQLIRFTEDILEMVALDSGQGVRVWEPIHVVPLILDTTLRYHDVAAGAGIALTSSPIPPDLPAVRGDPKRVAQMLAEIVENAVTFTPSGGRITIEVRVEDKDERVGVAISVTDSGPGILLEELDKVFDRFFRGHLAESGHILGTGLGLSLAHEIARAHGGTIAVESTMGEGATFTIWLPGVSS